MRVGRTYLLIIFVLTGALLLSACALVTPQAAPETAATSTPEAVSAVVFTPTEAATPAPTETATATPPLPTPTPSPTFMVVFTPTPLPKATPVPIPTDEPIPTDIPPTRTPEPTLTTEQQIAKKADELRNLGLDFTIPSPNDGPRAATSTVTSCECRAHREHLWQGDGLTIRSAFCGANSDHRGRSIQPSEHTPLTQK